jgi:hypothetical protein
VSSGCLERDGIRGLPVRWRSWGGPPCGCIVIDGVAFKIGGEVRGRRARPLESIPKQVSDTATKRKKRERTTDCTQGRG